MSAIATMGTVIGLDASLGAVVMAWARFGPERKKTAAELWQLNSEAWEARVKALEEKVEHLTTENAVLRSVVSGEAAVKALATAVESNHVELLAAIAAIKGVSK